MPRWPKRMTDIAGPLRRREAFAQPRRDDLHRAVTPRSVRIALRRKAEVIAVDVVNLLVGGSRRLMDRLEVRDTDDVVAGIADDQRRLPDLRDAFERGGARAQPRPRRKPRARRMQLSEPGLDRIEDVGPRRKERSVIAFRRIDRKVAVRRVGLGAMDLHVAAEKRPPPDELLLLERQV